MVAQGTSGKKTYKNNTFILLGVAIIIAACGTPDTPTQCPEVVCPEVSFPEPVLYEDLWAISGHADDASEAFNHWNEDEPPEIPVECAKCHSRPGFISFIGADGSSAGVVDNPAIVGTTITCYVCHNEVSLDLDSAEFPSGVKIRQLGPEARCIQCHQGRASTPTVNGAISALGLENDDTSSEELEFINSHSISAATPFGTEVQGGFEYDGKTYAGRFVRGNEFFSCIRCHDKHTLELQFETCSECHTINGSNPEDIRVNTTDFDGDDNIQEGIFYEIEYIHSALLESIQKYSKDITGIPISYDPHIYPYYFIDTNGNGVLEPEEASFMNRFVSWTPRLLRAAYNYNYIFHDPGAYAHNSKYALQILFDSISDIGGSTSEFIRP